MTDKASESSPEPREEETHRPALGKQDTKPHDQPDPLPSTPEELGALFDDTTAANVPEEKKEPYYAVAVRVPLQSLAAVINTYHDRGYKLGEILRPDTDTPTLLFRKTPPGGGMMEYLLGAEQ